MKIFRKIEKAFAFFLLKNISYLSPAKSTKLALFFYRRWGMDIVGIPNYISSSCWFDGADYSRIHLMEGCTISSKVSFLTHDWSLHTVGRLLGHEFDPPLGRHGDITVGKYAFIGRGVIIMPGANIGKGSIIGAGSVVRGKIPEFSIVVGNPGKIVKSSKNYFISKTGLNVNENS